MGMHDTVVSHIVRGFVRKIQRSAIAYAICAVCGIAVLILATGAAVMALIPVVGAVYAQLIVAGVFLLVIVITMFWLQRPAPRAAPGACRSAQRRNRRQPGAIRADRHDHRSGDARLFDVAAAALEQETSRMKIDRDRLFNARTLALACRPRRQ